MPGGDWRKALLRSLGAPATPQNLRFLSTWQRWEGGHTKNDAKYNWLNTTHGPGRGINSVGVKAFDSFDIGIRSTAETLMNGRYDDIVMGLTRGNPFKVKPTAGLSTWVSGSPTARPDYAAKVLGQSAAVEPRPSRAKAPARSGLGKPPEEGLDWNFVMDFVFDDDPEFAQLMKSIPDFDDAPRADPGPSVPTSGRVPRANGKTLNPGTEWKGSHVTDGLDWNNGQQTATDIMANPGTAVLAPESGTILKHGSAQGGQALYFLSDSGHLYWMGHIDNMAPVGTKVKRGQRIALISSDHAAPHLHIDRYYGKNPRRYA